MRRYWIPVDTINGDVVEFTGDIYHHIVRVCRQQVGSKFEVLVDGGQAYLVEMSEVGAKRAKARILEKRSIPQLPLPLIHLCMSVSRFPTMDAVVEKAVELGVAEVRPFFSDHSFIRKTDSLPKGKMERWQKIITMATQQSGRGELMKMHEPITLEELVSEFNRQPNSAGLFPYEGPSDQGIRPALTELKTNKPEQIWVFVGSEGGFSRQEVKFFAEAAGLIPVSMGSQVLRVETACLALISVIKYEFDLMNSQS